MEALKHHIEPNKCTYIFCQNFILSANSVNPDQLASDEAS